MRKKAKTAKRRRKPEKDENQMAFDVLSKVPLNVSEAARAMGKKGGIARKANLSNERLTEIGKEGATARWNKTRLKLVEKPAASG
jgi:hypothetical protein